MKKFKYILFATLILFFSKTNVYASSASLTSSSTNVYVGDTFTVYVNMSQAAAWNLHVSSTGPVSGCSINQADATSDALDTSKTFTATCTATSEGNISVKLSGDVTSAVDGNSVNVSGSINIIVSKKNNQSGIYNDSPKNNTSNNNASNNNNKYSNSNNTTNQELKSDNNNIKELHIDNYNLEKIDSNNYNLTVRNDVSSVNISGSPEDSKSQIIGLGKKELIVGENNILITVISESGRQNVINIKINRKAGFTIDDLEYLLSKKDKYINIIISEKEKISSDNIVKIKNSKKIVNFNYQDDSKKVLYSWIIDGSKILSTNEFNFMINVNSKLPNKFSKLVNYADGLYVNLSKTGNIVEGVKLRISVGDKYEKGDKVNIYSYFNNKITTAYRNLKVNDGYVKFNVKKNNNYFISKANISNVNAKNDSEGSKIYLLMLVLMILLSITIVIYLIRIRSTFKK